MEIQKLIKFMEFLGFSNFQQVQLQLQSSQFDLTDVTLQLIAVKIGEDFETVKKWFTEFDALKVVYGKEATKGELVHYPPSDATHIITRDGIEPIDGLSNGRDLWNYGVLNAEVIGDEMS